MMLDCPQKSNFMLKTRHLSLVNAHINAKLSFKRSTVSNCATAYQQIESISLDNSILSLNHKFDLPAL